MEIENLKFDRNCDHVPFNVQNIFFYAIDTICEVFICNRLIAIVFNLVNIYISKYLECLLVSNDINFVK